tara:strand:+ start:264 stop:647 length:384 start_codon:yes stop_codon:yes gene_type:complete
MKENKKVRVVRTREDFYRVIYKFHVSIDKRQTTIAESLRANEAYVSKVLTRYFDLRMNLGELAEDVKSMDRFVSICLEDDKNEQQLAKQSKDMDRFVSICLEDDKNEQQLAKQSKDMDRFVKDCIQD